jgi:hypothetical protein
MTASWDRGMWCGALYRSGRWAGRQCQIPPCSRSMVLSPPNPPPTTHHQGKKGRLHASPQAPGRSSTTYSLHRRPSQTSRSRTRRWLAHRTEKSSMTWLNTGKHLLLVIPLRHQVSEVPSFVAMSDIPPIVCATLNDPLAAACTCMQSMVYPNAIPGERERTRSPSLPSWSSSFEPVSLSVTANGVTFNWRGKGLLMIASSRWEVLGYDTTSPEPQWAVTCEASQVFRPFTSHTVCLIASGRGSRRFLQDVIHSCRARHLHESTVDVVRGTAHSSQ